MSFKLLPHAIRTFAYPLVLDMLKIDPYARLAESGSLPTSVRHDGRMADHLLPALLAVFIMVRNHEQIQKSP
jgi:hypothetical protein